MNKARGWLLAAIVSLGLWVAGASCAFLVIRVVHYLAEP